MQLFDAHAHITDPRFDEDRSEVIARMREAGVQGCLLVTDPLDETPCVETALALAETEKGFYAAVGVHPHNASKYTDEVEAYVLEKLRHPRCVALGEIGLDYHYDLSEREDQKKVFARQLYLAWREGKKCVLHIREAFGDAMEILHAAQKANQLPPCQMHCYSGSWETAKECLAMGMMISFSGSITFKNANKLLDSVRNAPADRILVETDCPYLAPIPNRGKRNESAFVAYTAVKAAELREIGPDELARTCFDNAVHFFDLHDWEAEV